MVPIMQKKKKEKEEEEENITFSFNKIPEGRGDIRKSTWMQKS